MVDFKKLMKNSKTPNNSNTTTHSTKTSELASKFKKRTASILDKTYQQRGDKSKASSMGKLIYNQEIMEQFDIKEFRVSEFMGERYMELLPPTFNPEVPYFLEVPVHYQVGLMKDAYICLTRYKGKPCYRCEQQQLMYRQNNAVTDEVKRLYPNDRIIYLVWDRTQEIIMGKSPEYKLKLWAAPKTKVHAEIQGRTRNKLTREILDITDITDGGDGRTITFEINKPDKSSFPVYSGFDLIPREDKIPDEILKQLETIIEAAEAAGFNNVIEMFLHIPEYNEVKESMETENMMENLNNEKKELDNNEQEQTQLTGQEQEQEQYANPDAEEDMVKKTEILLEKLTKMNGLAFKIWCKKNNYTEVVNSTKNKEEAIELIGDQYFTQLQLMGNDDIPF